MGIQLFTQLERRQTLPGFSYAAGETEATYLSSQVGSPATRWSGFNRTGWTNPEYDRLFDEQLTLLDLGRRQRVIERMQQIVYEDCPYVVLLYEDSVQAYRSDRFTGWPVNREGVVGTLGGHAYREVKPRGIEPGLPRGIVGLFLVLAASVAVGLAGMRALETWEDV